MAFQLPAFDRDGQKQGASDRGGTDRGAFDLDPFSLPTVVES